MLKSRWIQRFIWTADCLVSGIILDQYISWPLWTILAVVVLTAGGNIWLNQKAAWFRKLGVDEDTAETLRSVVLAFVFFALSSVAAMSIT